MKNKYEIGQRLWPVTGLNGRWFVNRAFDCQFITAERNEVKYGFTADYGFYEINVFASEAEAMAEVERRNGVGT